LLFRLDAERAHSMAFALLRVLERLTPSAVPAAADPRLRQTLWGHEFRNPVGLAAGFDKNAAVPHVWARLGFGFAELGTVTAQPQPGNPRPRLFRLPADRALINRLGFNNQGAAQVAAALAAALRRGTAGIPLGINIGKSRLTPIEQATADYTDSFRKLAPHAAYIVVNVSSPNTPGLRDLQSEANLASLLSGLQAENASLVARGVLPAARPLLVKVAPDLSDESLAGIVRVIHDCGAAGIVATNTTLRRDGLTHPVNEAGGLSGAPLRARATQVIAHLHRLAGPDLPIIGVGGIFDARDAYEKIRAGARLVQIYTGLIYEGPGCARSIATGLLELLERDGLSHLREAVGRDAREQ
jgi:dihydroorotate dehydrogenase